MQLKIENIVIPWYNPRKEFDPEYIDELAESMKTTGQWDEVLVRRNDESQYELIAGTQRLKAAEKIGWKEIAAKVLDVTEEEATLLAIETNMVRRGLKEIEEGKALKAMMDKYGYNQTQLAERLRKSLSWVNQRLALVLRVHAKVRNALEKGWIVLSQALLFSDLDNSQQINFLDHILAIRTKRGKQLTLDEVKVEKVKFLNDTIYTIGFSGWDLDQFVKTLKENEIKVLVDVRESGKSQYKPEFNRDQLSRRIKADGIMFFERPKLGVPYDMREAVKDGYDTACFRTWYNWHVTARDGENKTATLSEELKNIGRSVLFCSEQYAKPKGTQKHHCHRDFLADLMMQNKIFEKRVDL